MGYMKKQMLHTNCVLIFTGKTGLISYFRDSGWKLGRYFVINTSKCSVPPSQHIHTCCIQKLPNMYTLRIQPNLGSFLTISRPDELGSFFGLLRWDRGSNALLLSTKKPTFRTTWILTYIGSSNILKVISHQVPVWKWNFRFFLVVNQT